MLRPGVRRWLPDGLTALVFVLGVVWRYVHIFRLHDPRKYVYSDMQMYVSLGKRLARPDYVLKIGDVTHPPGLAELIAYFFQRDAEMTQLVWFQFAVTAAVPLAVGLLGLFAFDKTSARLGIVVTSFYFPFVDYGGYFLAEIYLAFLATLTLACYFAALRVGEGGPLTKKRLAAVVAIGAVGGLVFSLAMAMKMVALPAILGFAGFHFVFTRGPARKVRALALAAVLVAAFPLTYDTVDRCTRANDGQFCMGSNKAPSDFLLGHYGRIQGITWKDPKQKGHVGFGSPAAYQHGYGDKPTVPFLITNHEKNKEYAWAWIRKHPEQSFVLSFEHVWDVFGGSLPWPAVATAYWPLSQAFHYLFIAFMFFPTFVLFLDVARKRGLFGLVRSVELAVFAPLFGVLLSVFLATGEVRYRVPWDASFILLAIEFFRRLKIPLREPVGEGAGAGASAGAGANAGAGEPEAEAEEEADEEANEDERKPEESPVVTNGEDADEEPAAREP